MIERNATPEGLAQQVADGEPTDWKRALDSTSDAGVRRVIESLRLLDHVARIHRGDLPGPGSGDAKPMAETVAIERPPQKWGHLELRERLGAGGFGEVFRAWDPQLEREVALKLVSARDVPEPSAMSKAVEEGRLLAKLRHPNVVTVYGADARDDRVGLWMELVRGRSLEQLLHEQGHFGARETAVIGLDVCRALAAVHRAGVIHRDIKAQNVMREEGGRILLMDFGAGVDLRREGGGGAAISGTPLYMAPELFRNEPATQRSDVYSVGVLLYRLVTGTFPLMADTWEEMCYRHGQRERKLLRDERPDLPEGFVSVVERAMAWDPSERFATAGQMEQALAQSTGMGGVPTAAEVAPVAPERHPRRWVPAALVIAVFAIVSFIVLRGLGPSREAGTSARLSGAPSTSPAVGADNGAPTPPKPPLPVAAAVVPSYTVDAGVYRFAAGSAVRERLEPGARLALGDRLTLEFEASTPLHVYVINEDETGHSYALFPLPGLDGQNPLAAGVKHVLPGSRAGRNLSWVVDSPGGREHLLVLASPTRLVEFEADMNSLARPGQVAVPIPERARVHLRGLGGLAEAPASPSGQSATSLFQMAQRLAAGSEVTKGVWMRQLELENPR